MSRETSKVLKETKGLLIKRTKKGQRYLLHDKDLRGKDIYVTIDITDKTPKDEYSKKIELARIKLNAKKNCVSFEKLISEYISLRNLAQNTADGLRVSLRGFGLDNEKNQEIVANIVTSELKKSSIKTRLSHISSFFRWVILNGKSYGLTDPTQGIRIKEPLRARSRTLSNDEIDLLFSLLKTKSKEDQLVIRLAFFTGARISSICALQPDSIRDGKIYYYNKKCEREYKYPVPIKDLETINIFNELSKSGKIIQSSEFQVKQRINAWLHRIFQKKDGEYISIHSLRHTFATRAIQAGVAPEIVARLLDHSSVSTTLRVYAKHSENQLDQAIDTIFYK